MMAMLYLLLAVVLMHKGFTDAHATEPSKCCLYKQYTAVLDVEKSMTMFGLNTHSVHRTTYSYDFYGERESNQISSPNPGRSYELFNYQEEILYDVIQRHGKTTCIVLQLRDQVPPPCIPETATYLGRSRHGNESAAVEVNTWTYNEKHKKQTWTFTDGCVPVVNVQTSPGGKTKRIFHQYKAGIQEAAFQEPNKCHQLHKKGFTTTESAIIGR